MRLAARSNWLWAMALPDIVVRGVAVTDGLPGSSEELVEMQSPAGAARRRMLDFGHRVQRVRHAVAAGPRVGEDADDVGLWRRRLLRGMLEDKYQAAAVLLDGPHGRLPGGVGGEGPRRDHQRHEGGVE